MRLVDPWMMGGSHAQLHIKIQLGRRPRDVFCFFDSVKRLAGLHVFQRWLLYDTCLLSSTVFFLGCGSLFRRLRYCVIRGLRFFFDFKQLRRLGLDTDTS